MLNANVAFANGANHIGEVRTVSVRELVGVAGFIFGMAVSVMAGDWTCPADCDAVSGLKPHAHPPTCAGSQ